MNALKSVYKFKTIVLTALLALSITFTLSANAQSGHFSIGGGTINGFSSDLQAIDDTLPVFQTTLGWRFFEPIELYVGYSYRHVADSILQNDDMSLSLHEPELGARYTYSLLSWLDLYGRGGLRLSFGKTSIDSYYDVYPLEATDFSYGLNLALGAAIIIPREYMEKLFNAKLGFRESGGGTIGIFIEAGMPMLLSHKFNKFKQSSPDDDKENAMQLEQMPASLGSLNTSGIGMLMGFVVYF